MKTAEAKTTSVASVQKANQPFFSKEREGNFFGESVNKEPSFFKSASAYGVNGNGALQTKLTIGEPNDKYEQEADAMADKVVQRLATPESLTKKDTGVLTKPIATVITPFIQTKCAACEKEDKLQKKEEEDLVQESPLELQRKPIFESNAEPPDDNSFYFGEGRGEAIQRKCAECEKEKQVQKKSNSSDSPSASSSIESSLNSSKGSGSPIPESTRAQMENSFGADFSNVRLHTDSAAVHMNKNLHAQAFTHGSDIYFNSGKYDTNSAEGKHLLAHELTHTVQQQSISGNIVQNLPGVPIRIDCDFMNQEKADVVPNAANIIVDKYTHLARVIDASQLGQIQKVLDAKEKMDQLKLKQKPFRDRITFTAGGRGGASSDIDNYDYLNNKIGDLQEIISKNLVFYINSKLLAADDILDAGSGATPPIQAFHEKISERFISGLIRIEIHPCLATGKYVDQFLEFSWQAHPPNHFWLISHDKGLIRFRSLMQFQGMNLSYQSLLYGELINVLGKMVELRRKMGDYYPEAVGKRIGVVDQDYITSDEYVNVGSEIGDPNGYYNDGRGRMELNNALFSSQLSKVARIVLRSKENWLHIFATDPNFDTTEMDDPIGERGWLYILTATKSPDIEIHEEFITKDGRDLQPARTAFDGPGWRTKRELSEFEEFAIGFIFGDAFEANSGSAMFGQIVGSVIPIVGQIADARDVAIGIHKIYTTGGKDGKLQTAFAFLGFIPLLGDYIKRAGKVAKNTAPEVRAAIHTDAVIKASNDIGDGVAQKTGKKLEEATEKGGKQGAEEALSSLPNVKKGFVDGVMTEARKNVDTAIPGLKQADEAASAATDAFGRRLPTLENPKLIAQSAFKVGEQVHYVKVVQIGNWKQVWICTQCGSLIGKIDTALADATGAAAERLKRLRNSAVDLEGKVNAGKLNPGDVDKKVGRISFELNELARKYPDMSGLGKVLREDLERQFLSVYKVSSINDLTPGAKEALARGYRTTPPGYHWRLADDGTLQVVRNPGSESLSKLKYNKETHRFDLDELIRESKKFESQTAADAFVELGGKDLKSDFGKFADVLHKELGIAPKKLIDDLALQNSKGFKGAMQDTVRHRLKDTYVEMLYSRITDVAHLANTATYKTVLASTNDMAKAIRAASHEQMLRISRQLGSADKGSLGERWFKEFFAGRGETIKTQVTLGPQHGIVHEATRKVDIFEDELAREVKNVTTHLGTDGTKQIEDLVAGIGKDVKVGNVISGYDSVRLVFLDPIGGAANAKWMVENLTKFKDASLSFQVMNSKGVPLLITPADVAKHGAAGLEKIILDWTKIQPKLTNGSNAGSGEVEANAMADKVVQNISRKEIVAKDNTSIQTKAGSLSAATVHAGIENKLNATDSGSPIPHSTKEQMESLFGSDFSNVRLHTDSSAVQMNKYLNAQAFTHGNDIYFNRGKYDADSNDGKHLLAHELTHVTQQNANTKSLQRTPDDKHDLTATQLSGDSILEKTFDNETTISPFRNSKGTHVKKIQEALIQLGIALNQFGADEQYGNETANGVKDFQQKASMSKNEWDGIVGRKTLGLLDKSVRDNKISSDTDKAEDDLKLNDPKKKAEDDACKGKAKDKPCSILDTIGIHIGADDAIERIDKVLTEQLPPEKTTKADYPNIFGSLFRNNDTRPVTETSDEVKINFNIIKSFIAKLKTDPSHVRCATECDGGCRSGSPAYHSNAGGKHIITFCPDFSEHKERTSIVIHECHHASIDKSKDIAYADTRLIDKLDHKEALRNAASFHLYAALVEDPKSDNMGPKVKDTNKISNATQQKNVDLALAFIQQWFRLVTFDMSRVSTDMDEARQKGTYAAKSRTDLINNIYVKWFGVTPAPAKPTETDVKKAKVIEERSNTMDEAFNKPFTISESATVSEWERGPGKNIQLNQALMDLDINHMVIALLQELVHATPEISAESEPLYVGTINDLRNDRELAP